MIGLGSIGLVWGGRGLGPGLFALGLLACAEGPGPVADRNQDWIEPRVTQDDGIRSVLNHGPAEGLRIYEEPFDAPARLLFMEGRAATPVGEEVAWPDLEGGRLLVFDERGLVSSILQGATEDGRSLARPAFAAPGPDGTVVAIEADGSSFVFQGGAPTSWHEPDSPGPVMSANDDVHVGTRSVLEFELAPLRRDAPLLWVRRGTGSWVGIDQAVRPTQAFLGPLTNAGWVVVGVDGSVWYASALRPEVRRYEPDGSLSWISRWTPSAAIREPTLASVDGQVSPRFEVLQYAIASGPDGLAYVLAASKPDTRRPDLLLVFDHAGGLVRAGPVQPGQAVFGSHTGHVFTMSPHDVISRTDAPERVAFEPFEVPSLQDGEPLRLEQHRGNVVVINFWASWCGPCRREMPQLDELAAAYDASGVTVLGLNEDLDPSQAVQFLEELGGVRYANGAGRGRLRSRYRYRGLPYTVILDTELREVRRVYGFGTTIEPIKQAVETALSAPVTP